MDKYARAVEYLLEHPEQILNAWSLGGDKREPYDYLDPRLVAASDLFQFITPTGSGAQMDDGRICGCLTQIKGSRDRHAWCNDQLTNTIRQDPLVPCRAVKFAESDAALLRQQLERFAEYQREADATIRKADAHPEPNTTPV